MRSGIFAGLLLATVSAAAAFAQGARSSSPMSPNCPAAAPPSATTGRTASISRSRRSTPRAALLGRKLEVTHADTQIEPRRRARAGAEGARQRSLCAARARLLRLRQGDRAARRGGRNRADHGRRSRRPDAGRQQVPVPHLVRPAVLDAEDRQLHARRAEGEDGRGGLGQQRFRQGRPRRHHQGIRQVRHQGRRRHLDRSRPGRFRRRRRQGQGRGARCRVRLYQRGRERALAARSGSRAITCR